MNMKCQNQLGASLYCAAKIPEDSFYEVTQGGIVICEPCVETLLKRGVNDLPEDGRGLKGVSKKPTMKSAPCEFGKIRTVKV